MTGTSPRKCFYIPPDQHDEHGWIPSLVTEGEPGHAPLTGNGPCASPWYWGKTLEEAQGTAAVENARLGLTRDEVRDIILSSAAADHAPETVRARDAEIRIYDRADGTGDASDMYIMEALGVTVRVRLRTIEGFDGYDPDTTEPYVSVEASGPFTLSVNDDEHSYNDGI